MTDAPSGARINWLRLRALVVALPALLAVGGVGNVLLDPALERAIEDAGADIVGARVDVDGTDFQPLSGRLLLGRIQVANPDAPFSNLIEVREVQVGLRIEPLLEKKFVADSFVIRGIRFGTARETSGVLDNPSPGSGQLWRDVNEWADGLTLPEFSLEGLRGLVDTEAIDEDSLSSLTLGRSVARAADSLNAHWRAELQRLDPRPLLDSATVLGNRLAEARETRPSLLETARLVRSTRSMITRLDALQGDVRQADNTARADIGHIQDLAGTLGSTLEADVAYGRRLLRLPSLEAPSFSPVVFHKTAITWLKPVLFWVHTAERYLPPGLDRAFRAGPRRLRAPGTTVTFPGRAQYPQFLLERGALDLEIGGSGLAAGKYAGSVRGLSSAPSLTQTPLQIEARRSGAASGPDEISLRAVIDHARQPIRDSVALFLEGVELPSIEIPELNSRLVLGMGRARFALARSGSELDVRIRWASDEIAWEGEPVIDGDSTVVGSTAWSRAFLWRSLTGVTRLELDMGLSGSVSNPSLQIRSNLGDAMAQSLRDEVGVEVERAELRLRSEIEERVQPVVTDAQARVSSVQALVDERVGALLDELAQQRTRLEEALRALPST